MGFINFYIRCNSVKNVNSKKLNTSQNINIGRYMKWKNVRKILMNWFCLANHRCVFKLSNNIFVFIWSNSDQYIFKELSHMHFVINIDNLTIIICTYVKSIVIIIFFLHRIQIFLLKIVCCPVFKNTVNKVSKYFHYVFQFTSFRNALTRIKLVRPISNAWQFHTRRTPRGYCVYLGR